MPTIPFQNFVFTDPVAAQQATQMAQILNAAQSEKNRNAAMLAQEGQRQQAARYNAAEQRALTQAQMAQQTSESEKNRIARALETDKYIKGQESVAGIQAGAVKTKLDEAAKAGKQSQAFKSITALIGTDDPPTDSEFTTMIERSGIADDEKLILRSALEQSRRAVKLRADQAREISDYWNSVFDNIRVGEDTKFNEAKRKFEEWSKDKSSGFDLIIRDPKRTFRFNPRFSPPRMDAPTGVPTAPVPITPIGDLLSPRSPLPSTSPLLDMSEANRIFNSPFQIPQY